MLGLMAGNSISCYVNANIILFALVPWFLLWALKIESLVQDTICKSSVVYALVFILFLLGFFCMDKTLRNNCCRDNWSMPFVYAFSIKLRGKQKFYLITVYALVGFFFGSLFYSLEKINFYHTGVTADKAYEEVSSEVEAPLTGNIGSKVLVVDGWFGVLQQLLVMHYRQKSIAILWADLGKAIL